jgi:hypothetical protein
MGAAVSSTAHCAEAATAAPTAQQGTGMLPPAAQAALYNTKVKRREGWGEREREESIAPLFSPGAVGLRFFSSPLSLLSLSTLSRSHTGARRHGVRPGPAPAGPV